MAARREVRTAPTGSSLTLLRAYRDWDRRPGDAFLARRCEDVIQQVAAELNMRPTAVRLRIVEGRRTFRSLVDATRMEWLGGEGEQWQDAA